MKRLTTLEAVALMVTLVVGVGVFKVPALVAQQAGSIGMLLILWILGGMMTMLGASCYAELAARLPEARSEQHFLQAGMGDAVAWLFGWSRLTVIQTGAISVVAFIFGDYLAQSLPGTLSAGGYAGLAVALLSLLQALSDRAGKWAMNGLALFKIVVITLLLLIGFSAPTMHLQNGLVSASSLPEPHWGLAMVFVLWAYGGWNEIAYLAGDVDNPPRMIRRSLLIGTFVIILVYLLINLAYLNGLSLSEFAASTAPAWDLVSVRFGDEAARTFGVAVAMCALGVLNATIMTGARSTRVFLTSHSHVSPKTALLIQAAIALSLVGFGAFQRDGFEAMVAYTAPVFWFFLMLSTLSLIVFRQRSTVDTSCYRVPCYPWTPLIFAGGCLFMIIQSLLYAGIGALLGVGVLLIGVVCLAYCRRSVSTG